MTLTIPLTPEEEWRLLEKAKAEGRTPEEVVRLAIEPIVSTNAPPKEEARAKAKAFRRWAESFPADLPRLSLADVSREKLYERE